jgi:hypothetical protein
MKKLLIIGLFLLIFMPAVAALAAADDPAVDAETPGGTPAGKQEVTLENPLGKVDTPQKLIGQIINSILGLVGSIALLMFIWGGFQWMTAAGSSDKVEKGKKTLMWAALGMIVIFSSYALVSYLIKSVIGAK